MLHRLIWCKDVIVIISILQYSMFTSRYHLMDQPNEEKKHTQNRGIKIQMQPCKPTLVPSFVNVILFVFFNLCPFFIKKHPALGNISLLLKFHIEASSFHPLDPLPLNYQVLLTPLFFTLYLGETSQISAIYVFW